MVAAAQQHNQQVQHKTGVHTRSQYADAVLLGKLIQFSRQGWALRIRIGHFFSNRNAVDASSNHFSQITHLLADPGSRCQYGNIHSFFLQHIGWLVGDDDAELFPNAQHIAQVFTHIIGAAVNDGNNLNARLLEHQAHHSAAHCTEAPLKNTNWLHILFLSNQNFGWLNWQNRAFAQFCTLILSRTPAIGMDVWRFVYIKGKRITPKMGLILCNTG